MTTVKYPSKRRSKEHYQHMGRLHQERWAKTYWTRFWAKVDKNGPFPDPIKYPHLTDQCWEWIGHCNKGYGIFGAKQLPTHRLSWECSNGPIINGLFCLHKCDNRKCVNPSHLFLGTHQDNDNDRQQKGRTASGIKVHWFGKFGTKAPLHKLTEKSVKRIIELRKSGRTLLSIAIEFNVSRANIGSIINGKTWPHVSRL